MRTVKSFKIPLDAEVAKIELPKSYVFTGRQKKPWDSEFLGAHITEENFVLDFLVKEEDQDVAIDVHIKKEASTVDHHGFKLIGGAGGYYAFLEGVAYR